MVGMKVIRNACLYGVKGTEKYLMPPDPVRPSLP